MRAPLILLSVLVIALALAQDNSVPPPSDRCVNDVYWREWNVIATVEYYEDLIKFTYNVTVIPPQPNGVNSTNDSESWLEKCDQTIGCQSAYSFSVGVHPSILNGVDDNGSPWIDRSDPPHQNWLDTTYHQTSIEHSHSAVMWDLSSNPLTPGQGPRYFYLWTRTSVGNTRAVFQSTYSGASTRCGSVCIAAPILPPEKDPCYVNGDLPQCSSCQEYDHNLLEYCTDGCWCCPPSPVEEMKRRGL